MLAAHAFFCMTLSLIPGTETSPNCMARSEPVTRTAAAASRTARGRSGAVAREDLKTRSNSRVFFGMSAAHQIPANAGKAKNRK